MLFRFFSYCYSNRMLNCVCALYHIRKGVIQQKVSSRLCIKNRVIFTPRAKLLCLNIYYSVTRILAYKQGL